VPKRVLDGEGFWGSRKLRRCPLWIRKEYPYLYSLADCNGSFELDLPVILGKLKPNRPDLSVSKLSVIFAEFENKGIAYVWTAGDRQYAHWTGSERRGRLPRPSRRSNKYEKKLAPPIPRRAYKSYLQRFGETPKASDPDDLALATASATVTAKEHTAQASPSLRDEWFNDFWKEYPRKVGKPAAQRAWKKTPPRTPYDNIMAGLKRWKQTEQWQKEGGKFIPHPATFLNQRRWEDDPPARGQDIDKFLAADRESAVGRAPRTEAKPGKCECGAEKPGGFLKCLKCIKAKTPVNP